MRRIERTTQFKKDYKREQRGKYKARLETILIGAIKFLVLNKDLPKKYCDHALTGQWREFRDCHIRPDLLLIYEKPNIEILRLIRLGSHSELGF